MCRLVVDTVIGPIFAIALFDKYCAHKFARPSVIVKSHVEEAEYAAQAIGGLQNIELDRTTVRLVAHRRQ